MNDCMSRFEYDLTNKQKEIFYKYKNKYEGKSKLMLLIGEYLIKKELEGGLK